MKAKYILSIMALLIGASCSDDNENTPGFTLDEKEIQMEAVGERVKYTSQYQATGQPPPANHGYRFRPPTAKVRRFVSSK